MEMLDTLVEQRILEAIERGEFDDLPGAGAPLALDDDGMVPESLRVAYRILKNAGYVPPEVIALRELRELERAVNATETPEDRGRLLARMNALLTRTPLGWPRARLDIEADYFNRVAAKIAASR